MNGDYLGLLNAGERSLSLFSVLTSFTTIYRKREGEKTAPLETENEEILKGEREEREKRRE